MAARQIGPSPIQLAFRGVLVVGYVTLVALGLVTDRLTLVFWTMLLPLVPVAVVVMGFPMWRRICPLAFFGEVGRTLNRGTQRRVPEKLESWFFVVTFALLMAMLVTRLVATNGDGVWLAGLLVGLALAAAATNWIYTGKTWCNFICPVGLVERIYTEPNSLRAGGNSQCARCTACKRHCPDIDQENAYWRDVTSAARRGATFAFPGLVFSFYAYYWLRAGEWEAYFDGRWTRIPVSADLVLGSGFFFAPAVPAVAAATLTLLTSSAASFAVFVAIEAICGHFVEEEERRRHIALAIAAFSAFSIFYFFAGAPTLRNLPGATRGVAFLAPVIATFFLAKRWRRTREHFIGERGATRLLRNWPFDEPPPEDPAEVYAWIKAGEHAREQHLAAYENMVRGILVDGLLGEGELRLLEGVRQQLGVSQREHDRLLARLSEEERHLFERDRSPSVESRAQLDGYQTALAEALLRRDSERQVAALRAAFGVGAKDHEAIVQRMRGESGTLLAKARTQLERARAIHGDLGSLGGPDQPGGTGFLAWLLVQEQDAAVNRVLDFLEIAESGEHVRSLRPSLFTGKLERRRAAVQQLAAACPSSEELVRQLEPLIVERLPRLAEAAPPVDLLERLATATDPYVRAGAVWAAADRRDAAAAVERALEDADPVVRETAARARDLLAAASGSPAPSASTAAAQGGHFAGLIIVEKMQFLRRVPLFADLDPDDLHDLCLLAAEEVFAPEDALCVEGDVEEHDLFILVDGEASVLLRERNGAGEREIAILGAGEVVGELALLDDSPRSATVRPKGGSIRVLRIPGQEFRSRLLHRPRVARPLLATLAERLRRLSQRVVER